MTLKFTIPPTHPEIKVPRYGYYAQGVGFRTFRRLVDMKNSANCQGLLQHVYLPGQEDIPHYSRKYEYKTTRDWYFLELIDGEWYTRWYVPAGTKREDLPWMEKVVEVSYGYSSYYYPLDQLKKYEDLRDSDASYKPKTVRTIVRKKPDGVQREEYIQFRIAVALERERGQNNVTQPTLPGLDNPHITV